MTNTALDILSTTSRVGAPFIRVEMGGLTFGVYQKKFQGSIVKVDYPNYIQSLKVKKNANGLVNNYTLDIVYPVTYTDDPNFFEKVFSRAKQDRKIVFSYGDANAPNFIHREETAMITKVRSSFEYATIRYTVTAVSNSMQVSGGLYNFPSYSNRKPSDMIREILYSTKYGLTDIFTGMVDRQLVDLWGLIPTDDAPVRIEAQNGINILRYITYLVSCMRSNIDTDRTLIKKSIYTIATFDDIQNKFGGTYFEIRKITQGSQVTEDILTASIDVGFPDKTVVLNFNVSTEETFSILYDYDGELEQNSYKYDLDDNGNIVATWGNRVGENTQLNRVTEANRTWWTNTTSFPITASLRVRGLLRNIILMSKVKINVLFYGKHHIYSGVYMINGQEDVVDSNGYYTTLTLIRIGGAV